jgi:hypothetical protein
MCLKYPAIKRFFYQARKEKKKRKNQIPWLLAEAVSEVQPPLRSTFFSVPRDLWFQVRC